MKTQKFTEEQADRINGAKLVISTPGTYEVTVGHVNQAYNKLHESGAHQVGIINFQAMTQYHDDAAETLMAQGDYDEAVNQKMTLSVFKNDDGTIPNFPTSGEQVKIVVVQRTTSNNITGLFVKSWSPAPMAVGQKKTAAERRAARYSKTESFDAVLERNGVVDKEVPAFMK